jgi:hypothetical protein
MGEIAQKIFHIAEWLSNLKCISVAFIYR